MSEAVPTVFVIDDDASVRKGVARLLRIAGFVAETFTSAHEFLEHFPSDVRGCLVLDLAMPGLDGLQLQQALAERGSMLPIVFLTGRGDIPSSVRAMKQGAVDFLTKPVSKQDLLDAVRRAIERCAALRETWQQVADVEERVATLTPREREVLTHLLSGKLNKQIAADLGTVEYTIKVHRARVMRKMQAPTLAALIRLAERAGLRTALPGEN
jgi:FixJ family two-component response regulator